MRFALLTKIFHFEAAHDLPGHRGKCARLHGHSYKLEVTVRGPISEVEGESNTGMVMDFEDVSRIVRGSIIERLDHRYLNEVVLVRTTAENLAHWMWDALIEAGLSATLLYRLRLWETESGYIEITQAERDDQPHSIKQEHEARHA
jgi:6-pyruvoyltetrahydropterin/6-carboxytetrahydropterin synthase